MILRVQGSTSKRAWQVLPLSAKTETALETITNNLSAHLARSNDDLADVGYTLSVGRRSFSHRRVVLCSDREQALAAIEHLLEEAGFQHWLIASVPLPSGDVRQHILKARLPEAFLQKYLRPGT